jgi:hypothetical protein
MRINHILDFIGVDVRAGVNNDLAFAFSKGIEPVLVAGSGIGIKRTVADGMPFKKDLSFFRIVLVLMPNQVVKDFIPHCSYITPLSQLENTPFLSINRSESILEFILFLIRLM